MLVDPYWKKELMNNINNILKYLRRLKSQMNNLH